MTGKQKFDWMVKEIYFQSIHIRKQSDVQDDHSNRLVVIESNCRKALCDVGIMDNPKVKPALKYLAYGSVGTIGIGSIIYGILDLLKVYLQRGGQ